MKRILVFSIVFISLTLSAQTGVIRGLIVDQQSELPLEGVAIELVNSNPKMGAITDARGNFSIENVPLGRQGLRISYLGYELVTIPNIVVTAGKDATVTIGLVESFDSLDEIVLTSSRKKDRPINPLAAVSARQFGLEEVTRFSGGRGDVGRLAANFAGVSAPDDSRNDIVVRGNSPSGLLWRLEGIPIPNPNHFSAFGSTGGPVSAVNSNVLQDSDFITSAFPAEYGNALGGVFDLGFRKGNSDHFEFSFQTGAFTGVEVTAEGPLGKDKGSFLIAGRYSLVGLIGAGAAGASTATPNYTDLSFNIDLGPSKLGTISLFGILGDSDIDFLGDDIDEDDLFAAEDEDLFVKSRFGVIGLKHRITIGEGSYLKTVLSTSYTDGSILSDRYINKDTPEERVILFTEADNSESRLSLSTLFNSKLSSRITVRFGGLVENFGVESVLKDREEQADLNNDGDPDLFTFRDIDESLSIVQLYGQGQFRLSEKLTLNTGVHTQYSTLNEQFVIEPRAGLSYTISNRQTLSFGYGVHHQPVPFPILFLNENSNGQLAQTNSDLDFVRSDHYVIGYDVKLGKNWRGKLEAYYQDISKAAVEAFPSSYSSLTEGADFEFDNDRVSLINNGSGINKGIELTVEKFFRDGYYGLLTTSLFESTYKGSDDIERNSPFNNGYVVNFLTGREFAIGRTKKDALFFDTRITAAGGRYFTPVDLDASIQAGFEVLEEDKAYSEQYDDYLRWDLKFGIKLNSRRKKITHQLYFDLQNVTNRDNVFVRRFNRLTNNVDQVDQIGFFPDFGYKLQF
ncbi:MAG: TonB-dependent receptor [Flavobacteriaceae bacterium]|nr:TonB-dependent receptor [Flavobacteriaceae bacterium]